MSLQETNFSQLAFPATTISADNAYKWDLIIHNISIIIYLISIISLIVALLIYFKFPRLRKTLIKIHMHFFAAMLLQAISFLLHNIFFGNKIFVYKFLNLIDGQFDVSIFCRATAISGRYFLSVSFIWISIENWYFYSFAYLSPFKQFVLTRWLIFLAWGFPLIFVTLPSILIYTNTKNSDFCWTNHDFEHNYTSVIVFIIVLVNFCFFVLNIRVLFSKLNDRELIGKKEDLKKWIKSGLTLVPLFGAYDIFFSLYLLIDNLDFQLYSYYLLRFVCSIQGFLVATLYCFSRKEVISELRRSWRNEKLKRQMTVSETRPQSIATTQISF